jgi:hypothetical protein
VVPIVKKADPASGQVWTTSSPQTGFDSFTIQLVASPYTGQSWPKLINIYRKEILARVELYLTLVIRYLGMDRYDSIFFTSNRSFQTAEQCIKYVIFNVVLCSLSSGAVLDSYLGGSPADVSLHRSKAGPSFN